MPELVLHGIRLLAKQLLGTVLDMEVDQSATLVWWTLLLSFLLQATALKGLLLGLLDYAWIEEGV